jgi:nicotinamidase-related amidase
MPLTALDPRTALILIDLQKFIVALPTAHPTAPVVAHAAALADAFRRHALPVVLVNVAGVPPGRVERAPALGALPPDWIDLVPELNRQPQDHAVTKRSWGAFTNTGLAQHLEALSVTQLVIAGVATSIGVESTARQAHELGFNVTLATDAMTDLNEDAHANSVARIFPRLGETGTTREIIALLEKPVREEARPERAG